MLDLIVGPCDEHALDVIGDGRCRRYEGFILNEEARSQFKTNVASKGWRYLGDDDMMVIVDPARDLVISLRREKLEECKREDLWFMHVLNRNLVNFWKIRDFGDLVEDVLLGSGAVGYDYEE